MKFKDYTEYAKLRGIHSDQHEIAFTAARIGMVDADNCIPMPRPEEWPEWATELQVVFISKGFVISSWYGSILCLKHIPRPPEPWKPKEGEVVLAWVTGSVGPVIQKYNNNMKGMHCAKLHSLDDIHLTPEEIMARGEWV